MESAKHANKRILARGLTKLKNPRWYIKSKRLQSQLLLSLRKLRRSLKSNNLRRKSSLSTRRNSKRNKKRSKRKRSNKQKRITQVALVQGKKPSNQSLRSQKLT